MRQNMQLETVHFLLRGQDDKDLPHASWVREWDHPKGGWATGGNHGGFRELGFVFLTPDPIETRIQTSFRNAPAVRLGSVGRVPACSSEVVAERPVAIAFPHLPNSVAPCKIRLDAILWLNGPSVLSGSLKKPAGATRDLLFQPPCFEAATKKGIHWSGSRCCVSEEGGDGRFVWCDRNNRKLISSLPKNLPSMLLDRQLMPTILTFEAPGRGVAWVWPLASVGRLPAAERTDSYRVA